MQPSDYDFTSLLGLSGQNWNTSLYFVGTGMANGYDLGWMSTGDNRRDWGAGISGSHLAAESVVCLNELKLAPPYPDDTYSLTLTGSLHLLDLRNVESPEFSGDYYSQDRSFSCEIIAHNRQYLDANGYDGILRYSQPLLSGGKYAEVIALSPTAIGKIAVQEVRALGTPTTQFTIRLPDGTVSTPIVVS